MSIDEIVLSFTAISLEGPVCARCNRRNRPTGYFCRYCGFSLYPDKTTTERIRLRLSGVFDLETRCENCGNANRSLSKFCRYCGAQSILKSLFNGITPATAVSSAHRLTVVDPGAADPQQLGEGKITENSPPVTADGKHSLAVRATYGGAEAIDETKIAPSFPAVLEPTPAATTGAGGTTPQPTTVPATSEPPVVPTPTPPPGFFEKNRGLVIAVGGLGVLALFLLLVFALLRRRPSGEGEEVYEEIPTDLYAEGMRTPAASDSGQETPFIQPTPPTDMAGPMPTPALTGTRPGGPAASAKTEIIRKQPESIGYLIVKEGRRRGTQLPLTGSRIRIGREGNNDIALDDPTVSGNHAVVLLEDDDFYIQDIGSSNGTLVGGKEITKHKLNDGDEVTLGETVLIFKLTKLDG